MTDPDLVADATAYRALLCLVNRCVEVTIYAEGEDNPPSAFALVAVSPECSRTYVAPTVAKCLAAEFEECVREDT